MNNPLPPGWREYGLIKDVYVTVLLHSGKPHTYCDLVMDEDQWVLSASIFGQDIPIIADNLADAITVAEALITMRGLEVFRG